MPKIPRLLPTVVSLVVLAGLSLASPALASHSQLNFFEASSLLLDGRTRPAAIAQMQHLGVHAIRVGMSWANVAPAANKAARPGFEATNPARYAWGAYDDVMREAQRLHWQVLLTVTSPVPRWATSNKRAPYI